MHAPLAPERRLLLRAAELLREQGHCKNTMTRAGLFCAVAALHHCAGTNRLFFDEAVLRMGFNSMRELADWNDAVERTVEEVIEAMERAALS